MQNDYETWAKEDLIGRISELEAKESHIYQLDQADKALIIDCIVKIATESTNLYSKNEYLKLINRIKSL
jgi:hypothetical protein